MIERYSWLQQAFLAQSGAYVTVPLRSSSGELYGTLCGADPARRDGPLARELEHAHRAAEVLGVLLEQQLQLEGALLRSRDLFVHDGARLRRFRLSAPFQLVLLAVAALLVGWSAFATARMLRADPVVTVAAAPTGTIEQRARLLEKRQAVIEALLVGGKVDPALLASCFRRSLEVAEEIGARSVAFPAVSAGIYGWDAATVADVLVWANLRGQDGHGVMRIPRYVQWTQGGEINVKPNLRLALDLPAMVMLEAVRDFRDQTGQMVGVKPAGGIKTTKDAIKYLVMVNEIAGPDWLDPDWFRFGASTLLNDLLMQRTKMTTGRYSGPDYFTLD